MTTTPSPLWRRTLRAIDPLSRAASPLPADAPRDRARPSPGPTAARPRVGLYAHPRPAVAGRRASIARLARLAATAIAAFLVAFAAVFVTIGAAALTLYGLALLVGWEALAGAAVGAGITVGISEFTGWNRHRKLRELLDWLGEDNQARKMAALRADQRIRYMRGEHL